MQKTITTYNFDRAKAGKIMKQFISESAYNQSQVAQMASMTDDMMSNVLAGRNKEIGFERVFKICVITGHSICEFIRLMLEDEDVDFFTKDGCVICHPQKTDVIPQITGTNVKYDGHGMDPKEFNHYVEHMDKQNAEVLERFKILHEGNRTLMAEQYKQSIKRYEDQIKIITEEHKDDMKAIKDAHAETVRILTEQNKRLRCTSWILFGLFLLETIGVIALFMYDAMHPDIGWLRGLRSMLFNKHNIDNLTRG